LRSPRTSQSPVESSSSHQYSKRLMPRVPYSNSNSPPNQVLCLTLTLHCLSLPKELQNSKKTRSRLLLTTSITISAETGSKSTVSTYYAMFLPTLFPQNHQCVFSTPTSSSAASPTGVLKEDHPRLKCTQRLVKTKQTQIKCPPQLGSLPMQPQV
jgi:hypothetical protein